MDYRQHKVRESYRAQVEAGAVVCTLCFLPIAPKGEPCPRCGRETAGGHARNGRCGWDIGHLLERNHPDYDRGLFAGPQHACCNRRAGARNAARKTNAMKRVWSRQWLDN